MTEAHDEALAFTRAMLGVIREDLAGVGARHEYVYEDSPRNLFPAGNLGPRSRVAETMGDFRQTEYTPSSIGFLLQYPQDEDAELRIHGSFNVFLPTHPTLTEMRRTVALHEESVPSDIDWENPSDEHVQILGETHVKYRPKYVRCSVSFASSFLTTELRVDNQYHDDAESTRRMRETLASLTDDADLSWVPCSERGSPPSELPAVSLLDEADYAREFEQRSARPRPVWDVTVHYRAWTEGDGVTAVEFLLTNNLRREEALELPRHFDPHIFSAAISLAAPLGFLKPHILSMLPSRDYRINPQSLSLGVNCDTVAETDGNQEIVSTDYLPLYRQFRNKPARFAGYAEGTPGFKELAEDPIPKLRSFENLLREYAEGWAKRFEEYVKDGHLKPSLKLDYLKAGKDFSQEVERFQTGLRALENPRNHKLLTAFKLMNEAVMRYVSSNPRIRTWYPYQLAFIVSNLPDLLLREGDSHLKEPVPQVLWYPTGGGKTEAYMGLALAHAFWDRLRGKSFGITAWCKFPLRLLSMQQLSRINALVEYAEKVRASTDAIPEENKGEPFSVGLFAGGANSTNYLDWPPKADRNTTLSRYGLPRANEKLSETHPFILKNRKVDRCPICPSLGKSEAGKIVTEFDPKFPRFTHSCDECGHRLNLHVSDTETFRYLPTVVVGTIDKLAALGRVPETKVFFGYAKRRCPRHGYFMHELDECTVLSCGLELQDVQDGLDPSPSLLIQDELHFLRETLGAFDSHYETMTLAIMREASRELAPRLGRGWKTVGSTATIEGYEGQIRQLYGREGAIRFPVSGPVRGESFYSSEDPSEVQHFVLGFRPQNMSHVDAVMKVLLSFHRVVLPLAAGDKEAWRALGEPLASLSEERKEDLVRRYRTSLSYALTRAECGQINKSFVQQLNPQLLKEGLPTFEDHRVRNLTGELDSVDVQRTLNELENPPAEWIQAITATSMVSHGVDLDVLNFIVFRGQPHTISEWIQAMGRVGRADGYPSIVVNVYNPNRERDATYYRHHKKYIEHADALIRIVPITRFSLAALRKTAPGLFYNAVSFFASPPGFHYYYRDQLKRKLPDIKERVGELMRRYLDLPEENLNPKEKRLSQELVNQIESIQAYLENPTSPESTLKSIKPMTSLREVDELVTISPVYSYARFWSRRS